MGEISTTRKTDGNKLEWGENMQQAQQQIGERVPEANQSDKAKEDLSASSLPENPMPTTNENTNGNALPSNVEGMPTVVVTIREVAVDEEVIEEEKKEKSRKEEGNKTEKASQETCSTFR